MLPNTPPKGTADWLPDEFAIRDYIFQTWKQVNLNFGYQQYLTPIVETADIYRAKSGEDVGGKELMTMIDRAGRELAIRPEMTPSLTRMISRVYQSLPKPIRYFSIANYLRNERPQRGRNREFWQLNSDIFGSNSIQADIEILELALQIMFAFHAPSRSFTLNLNHRQLINTLIVKPLADLTTTPDLTSQVMRLLDKRQKLDEQTFIDQLKNLQLPTPYLDILLTFSSTTTHQQLLENFPYIHDDPGYLQITHIIDHLTHAGYQDWINFNPSIIRGFDYYDGMVFEVFDNHPDNNRAMFGGGRYNGLGDLFGHQSIPAVGFAPGDETTKLYLQSWNLLPTQLLPIPHVYLPLLDDQSAQTINKLANHLRHQGIRSETSLETLSITAALNYANKRTFPFILLLGSQELTNHHITIKNLRTGDQQTIPQDQLITTLKSQIPQLEKTPQL